MTITTSIVKVRRHPGRGSAVPWLIYCSICKPDFWFVSTPLAWSPNWALAQHFAVLHARRHHDEACSRCGHMSPLEDPTSH